MVSSRLALVFAYVSSLDNLTLPYPFIFTQNSQRPAGVIVIINLVDHKSHLHSVFEYQLDS